MTKIINDTLESFAYLKINNGLSSCFDSDAGLIIADANGNSGSLINFDYNNDGDLDIIAGFSDPYIFVDLGVPKYHAIFLLQFG